MITNKIWVVEVKAHGSFWRARLGAEGYKTKKEAERVCRALNDVASYKMKYRVAKYERVEK